MIGEFTRFSNAVLITEKYPVVRNFLKFWVSILVHLKRDSVTMEENLLDKNFMKCVKHSISKHQVPHPIHHGAMDCVRDIQCDGTLTETLLKMKEDTKSN